MAQLIPMIRQPFRRNAPRRAFSFVEILFAVMILGIGFIMIAGVFPVAIRQTAASQEETVSATVTSGAVATFSSTPLIGKLLENPAVIPNTGGMIRLTDDAVGGIEPWKLVKANQILPIDPRFGWTALLQRGAVDTNNRAPAFYSLTIITCQIRTRSIFTAKDDLLQYSTGPTAYGTLMPIPVQVEVKEGDDYPDTLEVFDAPTGPAGARDAAVADAVVVLAGGKDVSDKPCIGRIYRLGNVTEVSPKNSTYNPYKYDLVSGSDLIYTPGPNAVYDGKTGSDDVRTETSGKVDAFIVGRMPINTAGGLSFEGPSMVVDVYNAYVSNK